MTEWLERTKSETLIPNTDKDVKQHCWREFIAGGNTKWYSHFRRQFGGLL